MKMYQADAFSAERFKGNPAAVLVLQDWLSDALMQNIAQENNLAETAFVKVINAQQYEIRWFTPSNEVDFCGHATLASAFVLFKDFTQAKTIQFHVNKLGVFTVEQDADGKIRMNFPQRKAVCITEYSALLRKALHRPFKNVYLNEQAYIVEYEHPEDVLTEQPDLQALRQLARESASYFGNHYAAAGLLDVAITAGPYGAYDCVSRYFAPANGIDEDPVTGSIHTAIAPLWAEKLGKTDLLAYQASARSGELRCRILENQRIEISGYAKLFMQAEIFID